ncbi:MAG TPA: NAD(P)-binding domain-containing protein [Actinophytocola sp.]|jgi:3-hydroxyisobutyrate dehydrogenase|uniref:NAD(P)-dependent oxidoreductase n=1 Tax=Actinophytocola sp. TaxID=1872138 RepID=UPI002F941DAA
MSAIAFLGLGHMGSRMAARLVAAGHEVTVWNRTPGKSVAGASTAATAADAVADADVVITMLTGPEAVAAVVLGMPPRPDAVLVEMSTIGPTALGTLARKLPGVRLVDAPVGGSIGAAERGELTIFTGGVDADVEAVAPVLEALGTVKRCGGPGTGAAAKLVAITAVVTATVLLGELRELGAALHLSPDFVDGLLAAGPLAVVLERSTLPDVHYATELAEKDLGLALDHADVPLAGAALARLRAALPALAGQDFRAIATQEVTA